MPYTWGLSIKACVPLYFRIALVTKVCLKIHFLYCT